MDPKQAQQQNNRSTDTAWERFAAHRARVMRLLPEGQGGRIAWLGAGNCNDLDLAALAEQFEEVSLVDIDEDALDRALSRQSEAVRARCRTHLRDTSGSFDRLRQWRDPSRVSGLDTLGTLAAERIASDLGSYDVVVSSGVLSQIAWSCQQSLGIQHPLLNEVAQASVDAHLQSIACLTKEGGAAVVVVDSISNDKYAIDELCRATSPMEVLNQLSARGACYPTTHPAFVGQRLMASGKLSKLLRRGAWLWEVSDKRTMLVYALTCRSKARDNR